MIKTSEIVIFGKTLVFPFVTEKAEYTDETSVVKIEIKVITDAKTERMMFSQTTFKNGISPFSPITQREMPVTHKTRNNETKKETDVFSLSDIFLHESVITIDERKQFMQT